MSFAALEMLCALAVLGAVFASLRAEATRERRARWLGDYALLALAGFVGEESAITLYRHHDHAPDWHLRFGDVPWLVPLAWPLVVLSARAVREALFPAARAWQRPLLIWLLVCADASLAEVLATRADLWTSPEPGHLDVPLVAIVGWAHFAAATDVLLDRLEGLSRLLVVPASVLAAHSLICASWWYGLKWILRGDLGVASMLVVAGLGLLATAFAWRLRTKRRVLPPAVVAPRVVGALLALALLASTAAEWPYWAHFAALAAPSMLLVRRQLEAEV